LYQFEKKAVNAISHYSWGKPFCQKIPVLSGENSLFGVSRSATAREAALRQQAETATPKKEFSPDSHTKNAGLF